MGILKTIANRRRPVAIAIHDGNGWTACVFTLEKNEWRLSDKTRLEGLGVFQPPAELAHWAASQGAKRLRALVPGEPHELEIELPEDIEPHEAEAAVAFEISGRTGAEPDSMRVAMARADCFRMGGVSGKILASSFDNAALASIERLCGEHDIAFEGMGSLELSLLNYHARRWGQSRCLFLLPRGGFYAAPAASGQPFAFQNLTASFTPEERASHRERYERLGRRFQAHRYLPIRVWGPVDLDETRQDLIRDLLGNDAFVEFGSFEDAAPEMARHAAWARDLGTMFNGAAFAGRDNTPGDPHRAGSWMSLAIILGAFAFMGMLSWSEHSGLREARLREQRWDDLVSERERLKTETKNKRVMRNKSIKIVAELENGEKLPAGLLEIAEALGSDMPPYTRLTRLYQAGALRDPKDEMESSASKRKNRNKSKPKSEAQDAASQTPVPDGTIHLEGVTYLQQSIADMNDILGRALDGTPLRLGPPRIEQSEYLNELNFKFQITPDKDGRS